MGNAVPWNLHYGPVNSLIVARQYKSKLMSRMREAFVKVFPNGNVQVK